jgi:ferric-dicitrate binding protein FerR (iron transport regulator)
MTNEEHDALLVRYRACAEEVPASQLDQTILTAARRQSATHRLARRTRIAFIVTAFAAIAISLTWRSHQLQVAQSRAADYGKSEGATRSYLLNVTTPQYAGPGIAEGAP